jgi:transcriptional regulator with XRE-family HTH domain
VSNQARRNDPLRVRFYDAAGICIRQARMAAGWTQKALADAIGTSSTQLAMYEQGTAECPFHIAARIADALDLTCDSFAEVTIDDREDS